jgi:glycosyltransferase involved in cell wall biosynthesis
MKVLFVAMAASIHAARWISQLGDLGWELHLFPSDYQSPHPILKNITLHDVMYHSGKLRVDTQQIDHSIQLEGVYWAQLQKLWRVPFVGRRISTRVINRFAPQWNDRAWRLAETIHRIKPDLIHSLEIQHAGYLVLQAEEIYRKQYGEPFPAWALSNWGSDIYLYRHLDDHADKLRRILSEIDYYFCECERDVHIARELGLRGKEMPTTPVSGALDVAWMRQFRQPGKTSERRIIHVKGYQHWAGRALTSIRALELCADVLGEYRIVITYTFPEVRMAAELMAARTGLTVTALPLLQHEDLLRIKGKARITIGLSISDGISISFLEAMILGAFPIQSSTACVDEWAEHGKSALFVPPEDPYTIAEAIRRAVTDDALVDEGVAINDITAESRLDIPVIKPKVVEMYRNIERELSHAKT